MKIHHHKHAAAGEPLPVLQRGHADGPPHQARDADRGVTACGVAPYRGIFLDLMIKDLLIFPFALGLGMSGREAFIASGPVSMCASSNKHQIFSNTVKTNPRLMDCLNINDACRQREWPTKENQRLV